MYCLLIRLHLYVMYCHHKSIPVKALDSVHLTYIAFKQSDQEREKALPVWYRQQNNRHIQDSFV